MKNPSDKFRLLSRHRNWCAGASVSEYVNDSNVRRFVATIRGWQNWLIWEGVTVPAPADAIAAKVREIRDRIDAGDESDFDRPKKEPMLQEVSR